MTVISGCERRTLKAARGTFGPNHRREQNLGDGDDVNGRLQLKGAAQDGVRVAEPDN